MTTWQQLYNNSASTGRRTTVLRGAPFTIRPPLTTRAFVVENNGWLELRAAIASDFGEYEVLGMYLQIYATGFLSAGISVTRLVEVVPGSGEIYKTRVTDFNGFDDVITSPVSGILNEELISSSRVPNIGTQTTEMKFVLIGRGGDGSAGQAGGGGALATATIVATPGDIISREQLATELRVSVSGFVITAQHGSSSGLGGQVVPVAGVTANRGGNGAQGYTGGGGAAAGYGADGANGAVVGGLADAGTGGGGGGGGSGISGGDPTRTGGGGGGTCVLNTLAFGTAGTNGVAGASTTSSGGAGGPGTNATVNISSQNGGYPGGGGGAGQNTPGTGADAAVWMSVTVP